LRILNKKEGNEMNQMQIFKNSDFGEVRTVTVDNEPWFVGKDIADALGYERSDNAIRTHVDDEDKLMHQIDASGQARNMYIVNESGMYSLILSSKLPNAKQFKRWVTSEVIPQIRKNGSYMPDASALSPELALMNVLVVQMNQEALNRQKLQSQVNQTTEMLEETREEIQAIRDAIVINPKAEWRKETGNILNIIGKNLGDYSAPRREAYEALKDRARCKPDILINNLKKRALGNGMQPSRVDNINILDVLENDIRLREIYISIVKEMAIKRGVS
jgi:prophage antirepressor-like protein